MIFKKMYNAFLILNFLINSIFTTENHILNRERTLNHNNHINNLINYRNNNNNNNNNDEEGILSSSEKKDIFTTIGKNINRLETLRTLIIMLHDEGEVKEELIARINRKLDQLRYVESLFS